MNANQRRHGEPAEHEELARLLPPPGDPDLSPGRHRLLKEHLMREITRDSAPAAPAAAAVPARPRTRRRPALAAVSVLAAAAVAAGVTAGGVLDGGSPPPSAAVTAAERQEAVRLLDRIATAASARDASAVRDGQYVYVRTQGTREVGGEGTDRIRREDWHAVDGARDGLARVDVLSGPSKDGPADESGHDIRLAADPNTTTYRELQALPTDPGALLERLYADTEGQGPDRHEPVFEAIEAMLPASTLLPEVNAALYRAAAGIPGVAVDREAEDAAGRRGVGLVFEGADRSRSTWVFDRATLAYLGSDETAVLAVTVVDEPGDAPARHFGDRSV